MQSIGPRIRQSTGNPIDPARQGVLPGGGAAAAPQDDGAVRAAAALGEAIRAEHGREGIRRYLSALSPFLPRALLEQAATRLGVEMAPGSPGPEAHREAPPPPKKAAIPPEQLLKLLQTMGKPDGGGGGLDPSLLLKLMKG